MICNDSAPFSDLLVAYGKAEMDSDTTMSIADREKADFRPGIGTSKIRPSSSLFVRAFWLFVNPWFGFGFSGVFALLAILAFFATRDSSASQDHSVIMKAGFASLVFAVIAVAGQIIRREMRDRDISVR